MKEYIFENVLNCNITVTIKAYSFTQASEILLMEVKDFCDYKLIN